MHISVIYRCCELETDGKPKRECRPSWFSKEKFLNNALKVFSGQNVDFIAVHDGQTGPLLNILKSNDAKIEKINYSSNDKSLQYCLDFANNIEKTDILYFLEDDYLHTYEALDVLKEGFETVKNINSENIITLYDIPDRYTREDDIDYHQTLIKLGKTKYWRTAESTTCTWAITKELFNSKVHREAVRFGLNDREFFRHLRSSGVVLFTPMIGASTHCHEPFLSPFVDWKDLCQ